MHLNDFYEFGSIEPNSKKHRNIEKIRFGSIELIRTNSIEFDSVRFGSVRFGSVRFDSVRYSRKVLGFHCTLILSNFRKTRTKDRIVSYRIFFKNTEKEIGRRRRKTVELISNKNKK
jgi:hypothetical protein